MRARRSRVIAAIVVAGLLGGPAVAVTAQGEEPVPQPPVEFTGVWCIGPAVAPDRNGTDTMVELGDEGLVLTRNRGGAWHNAVIASDPRLQGVAFQTYENDRYDLPGIDGVIASTLSIVNEDGAWVAAGYRGTLDDGTDIGDAPSIFVGQGAYAGLVAVTGGEGAPVPRPEEIPFPYEGCAEFRGVIFDGVPVPEPILE